MPVESIWQAWCNRGECAWHEEFTVRYSAENALRGHLNREHRGKQEADR